MYVEKKNPEKKVNTTLSKDIVNTCYTWEELWIMKLPDLKDIKFAPKFFGLALATACTNGEVQFYRPTTMDDLRLWQDDYGKIQVRSSSIQGCTCIEWGTAFDEPIMLAVGCEHFPNKPESNLIQLYRQEGPDNKGSFVPYG